MTLRLANELSASLSLLDDYKARKFAKTEGLKILGSIGLLEAFYARGYLTDLRACFRQLISHNVYIDRRLLDRRLRALGCPHFRLSPWRRRTPALAMSYKLLRPYGEPPPPSRILSATPGSSPPTSGVGKATCRRGPRRASQGTFAASPALEL